MNEHLAMMILQLLLPIGLIVVAILFLRTQSSTLELIRPENRRMPSGKVWLQLIPLYGLVWQFTVINKISDSIRDELNAPIGDSIFADDPVHSNVRPTYSTGISYATLLCIGLIPLPLIKGLATWAAVILWIVYWAQLAKFKKKLKDRSVLNVSL